MKTRWIYPILLLSSPLAALPHGEEVAAGAASFQADEHSLVITASDKAILNFRSFDIGKEEMVQFIQPSKKAEVLARVVGSDSSQILGSLKANGRLFLVNPYGIYFGKDSIISTAGLVASTLEIRDRDFLESNYRFSKERDGEIFNEGTLLADEGGFVALLAPHIRNHGSIYARAGKVVLASGEHVALDFSGDGLLRFSVDGELKEALIEQAGLIDAAEGNVALSMRSVRQVLQELVNTDGVEVAVAAEIVGGVVRLLPGTNITASKIVVEGDDRISVAGAKLDASGETGGGEVFIGGGYKGEGDLRRSIFTTVDENTTIFADAKTSGNGGTVVIWSDDATLFDGTIFARGGALSGNGGLVETSGKVRLGVHEKAHVNTLAPKGSVGDWLLDPQQFHIVASGGTGTISNVTTNCTSASPVTFDINASVINSSMSSLTLCARSADPSLNIIFVDAPISMSVAGAGLIFDVNHTAGAVGIEIRANITTKGGALTFKSSTKTFGGPITINTTNTAAAGANITFESNLNSDGNAITINAGTAGAASFVNLGSGSTPPSSFTITAGGGITFTAAPITIKTSGGAMTFNDPVILKGGGTLTSNNGNITFTDLLDSFNNTDTITINAGTGTVLCSNKIGSIHSPQNLTVTGGEIRLSNNVSTAGGPIAFNGPVTLLGSLTIKTIVLNPTGANITFSNTLDGTFAPILDPGTAGSIFFLGAVGNTTALSDITVNQGSNVAFSDILKATKFTQAAGSGTTSFGGPVTLSAAGTAFSFTGTNLTINDNVTASAGAMSLTASGTITIAGNPTLDINGSFTETGAVQCAGSIITANNPITFNSSLSCTGATSLTTGGGTLLFMSTVDGPGDLTISSSGGTSTFTGAVGGTTRLGTLTVTNAASLTVPMGITAAAINQMSVTGATSYTGTINTNTAAGIQITGAGVGNIIFNDTISGGSNNLTLSAGTGDISFNKAVGSLGILSITSAQNVTAAALATISAQSLSLTNITGTATFNDSVTTSTPAGISFTGATCSFLGNLSAFPTGTISLDASSGATIGNGVMCTSAGTFTKSGAGPFNLGGSIKTLAGDILVSGGALTLTAPASLDSSMGAYDISIPVVNGTSTLTLNAGSGDVNLNGAIGSTPATRPTGLTISNCETLSANQAISLNGSLATTSSLASTFSGAITTYMGGSITVSGATALTFSQPVTSAGLISLTNSGLLTIAQTAPIIAGTTFTQMNATSVSLDASVTSTGAMTFSSPITLTHDLTLASNGGAISTNTIDAAYNLTLSPGTGAITLGGVGGGTALTSLTIQDTPASVTGSSVTTTGAITQAACSGLTHFTGSLTTTTGTIQLVGTSFTFDGQINTMGAAPLTIDHTGLITLNADINYVSSFTETGMGAISTAANITTSGGSIQFNGSGAMTLTGTSTWTSAGGNISKSTGTIGGAFGLTLSAGAGVITLGGAVGPLSAFTATGSTINQTTLSATGAIQETGILHVGDNITSTTAAITLTGNVTTSASVTIDAMTALTITGTVNGDVPGRNLTLTAGATLTAGGTIGGASSFNNLTFTGADIIFSANLGSAVSAATGTTTATATTGSITFSGNTYKANTQTYDAPGQFIFNNMTSATVTSSGGNVLFNTGSIFLNFAAPASVPPASYDFTINTSGGNISLGNTLTVAETVGFPNIKLNASTGSITAGDIGTVLMKPCQVSLTTGTGTATIGMVYQQGGCGSYLPINAAGTVMISGMVCAPVGGFTGPVIITGDATISAPACMGCPGPADDILFPYSLNANIANTHTLILEPCGKSVIFQSPVGNTNPLKEISIAPATTVHNVQVDDALTVGAFIVANGSGTATFSSGISSTGNMGTGISLSIVNVSFSGTNASTGGPINLMLAAGGTFTLDAGSSLSSSGAITQTGPGTSSLGGTIESTTASAINLAAPITLNSALSVTTSGGAITLAAIEGTTSGIENLDLSAGAATISTGNIGATTRVGICTFANTSTLTTGLIKAVSIQSNSGIASFDALDTNAPAGIVVTAPSASFSSTVSGSLMNLTTSSGTSTFSGAVTVTGNFSQTGAGTTQFADITSTTGTISIQGPATTAGATLTTTNKSITFGNTIGGPGSLTLNAGASGNITLSGAASTLTAFTITNANNVTTKSISAGSITQSAGSGLTNFQQDLTTTGALTLTGNQFKFLGNATIGGAASITHTGTLTTTALKTLSLSGGLIEMGGGAVSLAGTVKAGSAQTLSFAGPITLEEATTLGDGTVANNITLAATSTVNGNYALTLKAGTAGNITLAGIIGGSSPVGAITIQSVNQATIVQTTAASFTQSAGSMSTDFSAALITLSSAGASLTGTAFTIVSIDAQGGGSITINNSGLLTMNTSATPIIASGGSFSQTGTGSVLTQGTFNTENGVSFAGAVTLSADADVTATSGAISFTGTVNGMTAGMENLFINAGTGSVSFTMPVGGVTSLNDLTISNASSFAASAITAVSFGLNNITPGASTFSGALTVSGAVPVVLNGAAFSFSGAISIPSTTFTLNNSGLATFSSAATGTIGGTFTQTGAGTTQLGSAITAAGAIDFTGPVTTSGASASLDTSAVNQTINFQSTINGPGALSLSSGTAAVTFNGNAGTTTALGALTVTADGDFSALSVRAASLNRTGMGSTDLNGTLTATGAGGITISSNNISLTGAIVTTGGGPCALAHTGTCTLALDNSTSSLSGAFNESGATPVSYEGLLKTISGGPITFVNNVVLTGDATLNCSGVLTLSGSVEEAFTLTLSGTSISAQNLGNTTPLTSLTIASAGNATFNGAIFAGQITQTAGTALTDFVNTITTTLPQGVNLTGNSFRFRQPVDSATTVINNSSLGTVTIDSAAVFTLENAFNQTGTGAVSLSANITSTSGSIHFSGPVTLGAPVSLDISAGAGTISFANVVNGVQNLTLNAGTAGGISFSASVGPLNDFQVLGANTLTSQTISANTISVAGVATASLGALTTTGAAGISLSGGQFSLNGTITTSNLGPLTITNSGPLTLSSVLFTNLSGAFNQLGTGTVSGGGTWQTNQQNILFTAPVILTNDCTITTNGGGGGVTFNQTIDGAFLLVIDSGTGGITCSQTLGDGTPLKGITLTSAQDISLNGIGVATQAPFSINFFDFSPYPTTLYSSSIYGIGVAGLFSVTAANDINLHNISYSAQEQYYSAGGTATFDAGSLVTLTSFGGISFPNGTLALTTNTDLDIITNNGDFSFSNLSGIAGLRNVTINTGAGAVTLGSILGMPLNNLSVTAGSIRFAGPIDPINTIFISTTDSILNVGPPVLIESQSSTLFNALEGNVGSLDSPILIQTPNRIFAGAGSGPPAIVTNGIPRDHNLANFIGTSLDDTVYSLPSNPPCILIWNGVYLNDCGAPPPPPSPGAQTAIPRGILFYFSGAGFDSSEFNLSSDYFFLSNNWYEYLKRPLRLYYKP